MRRFFTPKLHRRFLLPSILGLLAGLASACDWHAAPNSDTPPTAEFLLTAGDSTYWVRSGAQGIRVRGAPLVLARYGGRFQEVYVTDEDHSYYDAVFVSPRLWRRDLQTGDSSLVFVDSTVLSAARSYAIAHPDQSPLEQDEDGAERPSSAASSDLQIVDVHGPYLSYEYRLDLDPTRGAHRHVTRRGVLDLRTGRVATLASLLGDAPAARASATGRLAFRLLSDSVRQAPDARAERAARTLESFAFDSTSFSLRAVGRRPSVAFLVPGMDTEGEALTMALAPIVVDEPRWWRDVLPSLPDDVSVFGSARWRRKGYEVEARADADGDRMTLVLRGGPAAHGVRQASATHSLDNPGSSGDARAREQREWLVARVPAPAYQLVALDGAAVDSIGRHGLARAFSQSARYDEGTQSVRGPAHHRRHHDARLARLTSFQSR